MSYARSATAASRPQLSVAEHRKVAFRQLSDPSQVTILGGYSPSGAAGT